MPTAINTTVKVYKGIPLIKGGTEVLYLSGAAADGVLSGAASAVLTYSQYYYTRENRGYIQIDDVIGNLEGANYIGFQNASHGGKWYFGFIDEIVYINDNCTEIRFTIDPFTTFIGDTQKRDYVYVKRNSPTLTTRTMPYFHTDDYQLPSCKYTFQNLGELNYTAQIGVVYFASASTNGTGLLLGTGIKTGVLSQAIIEDIQQNGGVIIGAYTCPSGWATGNIQITDALSDFTVNPFVGITATNEKLKSGVYTKLAVTGNSETKYYNIEDFDNPESITFGCNRLMIPCPSVFIYPKNYKGRANNLAEGFLCKFPSLPITANAVYTNQQRISELVSAGAGLFGGAASGANFGPIGAVLGGFAGAVAPMVKGAFTEYVSMRFEPPAVIGHGEPIVDGQFNLRIGFNTIQPTDQCIARIDDYLTRFGWEWNYVESAARISVRRDKDYLQTGEPFVYGSLADAELNARIMNGIRIRLQLP